MPIYEYICHRCSREFEAMRRFSDAPLETCECGEMGKVSRKLSLSAFQLKGGGWYKQGYSLDAPVPSKNAENSKTNTSNEAKSESKTERSGSESSAGEKSSSKDSASSTPPASGGTKSSTTGAST